MNTTVTGDILGYTGLFTVSRTDSNKKGYFHSTFSERYKKKDT